MKLVPVSKLFTVQYGNSLELNALTETEDGVPFVSRTRENNGVSAHVARIQGEATIPSGTLSVALGGNSVMSTFLQKQPYYTGRDVAWLKPVSPISDSVMLYYATCLRAHRFRFGFGRQANRTLPNLTVPDLNEVPAYVTRQTQSEMDSVFQTQLATAGDVPLVTKAWQSFPYTSVFNIVRGKGPSVAKAKANPGATPLVTASDKANGITTRTKAEPTHPANSLTVATNGSVGECFLQLQPFVASGDVAVLVPKEPLSSEALLGLATLIRREGKFKYGYGRKWGSARMNESSLLLPVARDGSPDWAELAAIVRGTPSWKMFERLTARAASMDSVVDSFDRPQQGRSSCAPRLRTSR